MLFGATVPSFLRVANWQSNHVARRRFSALRFIRRRMSITSDTMKIATAGAKISISGTFILSTLTAYQPLTQTT